MRPLIFAANWKMHIAPDEARRFAADFLAAVAPREGRTLAFFPTAVSIEATAHAMRGRPDIRVGAQDVHWEPKGAFTGATSVPLARGAGATCALVGHSERRHVFGETEAETGHKVRALLEAGMTPYLCVGEKLVEREAGATEAVVLRQLAAGTQGLTTDQLQRLVLAYEPVWAIGTGRNASPEDAAAVHRGLRTALRARGVERVPVLYGGSVSAGNAALLLAEPAIDGLLVGGASLTATGWAQVVETPAETL